MKEIKIFDGSQISEITIFNNKFSRDVEVSKVIPGGKGLQYLI